MNDAACRDMKYHSSGCCGWVARKDMLGGLGKEISRGLWGVCNPAVRGSKQLQAPWACERVRPAWPTFHTTGLPHFQFTGFSSFLLEIVFSSKIEWIFVNIWVNLNHIESIWVTMSSFLPNSTQFDSILLKFPRNFTQFYSKKRFRVKTMNNQ